MSLSTQIIILVLLVLGSAYFSGTEAALMSVNRIRIKNAAGNGNKKASLVLKFTENFDKVISTLLPLPFQKAGTAQRGRTSNQRK